jgi:hypothetical protein
MIAILLMVGGAVFGVLGGVHAIYTVLDLRDPRRLVPVDPSVAHAMANLALRLSGGRTDMWRAWIGFNFSHSLGVLLLAAVAIWAGARMRMVPVGIVRHGSCRCAESSPACMLLGSGKRSSGDCSRVTRNAYLGIILELPVIRDTQKKK